MDTLKEGSAAGEVQNSEGTGRTVIILGGLNGQVITLTTSQAVDIAAATPFTSVAFLGYHHHQENQPTSLCHQHHHLLTPALPPPPKSPDTQVPSPQLRRSCLIWRKSGLASLALSFSVGRRRALIDFTAARRERRPD